MHILVVDEDSKMRQRIKEHAQTEGIEVSEASDGGKAVEYCKSNDYDAVVMDIFLPCMSGYATCLEIKKTKDIPVIILSEINDENYKLMGFKLGIEDYVVKPFSLKELMARLNVIFRRNSKEGLFPNREKLEFEGLHIDFAGRKVMIDGKTVSMTPKEYNLLCYLVKNRNIAVSREQILKHVWGYDFFGDDRTVDVHIKMLRAHLGSYRKLILTVRSVGYKFEADII
jgi:two-component system response regulator ResD